MNSSQQRGDRIITAAQSVKLLHLHLVLSLPLFAHQITKLLLIYWAQAAASTPNFRLEDRRLLLEDIACTYLYLIKVNASCLPFHDMPVSFTVDLNYALTEICLRTGIETERNDTFSSDSSIPSCNWCFCEANALSLTKWFLKHIFVI